ncbi:hypothetical protein [Streptomyces sp. NPDC057257]|uniref:hypothetical protein n=1 Tax=Streptomyces sp. NPDC057257 TaxID=3346071 RepID=UPI003624D1E9
MTRNVTTKMQADYERALAAEPQLQAVVTTVDALCELVRPEDRMCSGCVWDTIVKPLARPLLGWDRGYPPESAKEPADRMRLIPGDELLKLWEQAEAKRVPADTETEKWLRTSEAWDAFTNVVLARLDTADPAHGHGIVRDPEHRKAA